MAPWALRAWIRVPGSAQMALFGVSGPQIGPHLGHIWTPFGSYLDPIWVIFGPLGTTPSGPSGLEAMEPSGGGLRPLGLLGPVPGCSGVLIWLK